MSGFKVTVTKKSLVEQAAKAVKVELLNKHIDEIVDLVLRKNHDYGDAWQRYGIFTPLIRINDKTLRLETLTDGSEALIADESVIDTLRDIIGYCLLALQWLDEKSLLREFADANRLAGKPAGSVSFSDYQEQAKQLKLFDVEPD